MIDPLGLANEFSVRPGNSHEEVLQKNPELAKLVGQGFYAARIIGVGRVLTSLLTHGQKALAMSDSQQIEERDRLYSGIERCIRIVLTTPGVSLGEEQKNSILQIRHDTLGRWADMLIEQNAYARAADKYERAALNAREISIPFPEKPITIGSLVYASVVAAETAGTYVPIKKETYEAGIESYDGLLRRAPHLMGLSVSDDTSTLATQAIRIIESYQSRYDVAKETKSNLDSMRDQCHRFQS